MSGEDFEARLAKAAEGVREHEIVSSRCDTLRRNITALRARLAELDETHAREQADVARLERFSLTSVIASLRGSRDDALAREKAEAQAVAYRVREMAAQLGAVERELQEAEVRVATLSSSRHAYAAAQADKERFLVETGGRQGEQLTQLAEERGRIGAELKEVDEAITAARAAKEALSSVGRLLDSASSWSTYDTFFGGGMISSSIKHSRLDEAAQAAAHADRALARLRTELADVSATQMAMPDLNVDGLTRFVDVWLDNIFTDLAVRDRIKQAQANVQGAAYRVEQVLARLAERKSANEARLADIETQRQRLLA